MKGIATDAADGRDLMVGGPSQGLHAAREGNGASVAINCRFLETEMRGIGRYALGLADALRGDRPADVRCLVSKNVAPHLANGAEKLAADRIGPLSGPLWEQVTLPLHLAANGRPLLVNFVNTAPVFYRRQITVVYDLAYQRHPDMYSASFLALYRTVIPRVVRTSRLVTISEFVKDELVAMGARPDRVDVVPCFVTPELQRLAAETPRPAAEGNFALMVGSLNTRKNLRVALQAFKAAAVPGLRLVVVGEGASVFRAVDTRDLADDRVTFLGAVSDAELVRLYREAAFLIFPSLYEGFGMPPIEAMQCDCPVIASRTSSIPEVCGDAALYFDPTQVEDIATAITRIAGDSGLRERLRELGRKQVAQFTLDRSARLFGTVIDRALREP